jgi:hypothetical protein
MQVFKYANEKKKAEHTFLAVVQSVSGAIVGA